LIFELVLGMGITAIAVLFLALAHVYYRVKKFPNPDMKKLASRFKLIPVAGLHCRKTSVVFKNTIDFIKHAPKNVKEIYVWDESCGYMFYFYWQDDIMFHIEIPKLVKA